MKRGRPPGSRARLNEIEAQRAELKLQREKGELLPVAEVRKLWSDQILRWRQIINNWDVAAEKKAELLKEMADLEHK